MQYQANSPTEYLEQLPEDRKLVLSKLRQVVLDNLPPGFEEQISYGMLGYVVPHSKYPKGYHCDPKLPLPFMSLASQKNFVAVYHMGVYASEELLHWFLGEYPKHVTTKPDMGKSCIRFKNMKTIPYALIGELCSKMTMEEWVALYEEKIEGKR